MDNAYCACGAERCCLSSSVGGIRAAFWDDGTNILFVPSLCIFRCAKNAQQTLRTEKSPPILGGCGFWWVRVEHETTKNAKPSGAARELTHHLFPMLSRESCFCYNTPNRNDISLFCSLPCVKLKSAQEETT